MIKFIVLSILCLFVSGFILGVAVSQYYWNYRLKIKTRRTLKQYISNLAEKYLNDNMQQS